MDEKVQNKMSGGTYETGIRIQAISGALKVLLKVRTILTHKINVSPPSQRHSDSSDIWDYELLKNRFGTPKNIEG